MIVHSQVPYVPALNSPTSIKPSTSRLIPSRTAHSFTTVCSGPCQPTCSMAQMSRKVHRNPRERWPSGLLPLWPLKKKVPFSFMTLGEGMEISMG